MKKFTKLIPAFCMLLISAMLMGTSTFAWFSMNTTVTANGMKIKAKSDSASLVINEGTTFDKSGTAYTATASSDVTLLPVAHGTVTNSNGTPSEITDKADMTDPTKWYYAYANDNTTSTAKDKTAVTCTGLTNYIAKTSFSIGLNDKSADTAKGTNLGVSKVQITTNAGIKVVVVCGTNIFTFDATNNGVVSDKVLANEVTKTGVVVDVYYFIDGNSTEVYTNNLSSLTGQIELEFSIAGVTNN